MSRVVFIALGAYSGTGGMQRFNARVTRHIGRLALEYGWSDTSALLLQDNPSHIPQIAGIEVRGFSDTRSGFVAGVIRNSLRADVLIVGHINLLPLAWILKILRPSLRVILFVHGIEVWNDPQYRNLRPYESFMLRRVDTIASVSHFTARTMAQQFGLQADKFVIFPNAVDGPVTENICSEHPTILSVSRMSSHDRGKNLDAIIRAFAALPKSLDAARLVIIGDGKLRPGLEEMAQSLGISQKVSFLGRVDDATLERAYCDARAFVLPSSKEGFGIVYLEAWKSGLPVICGSEGAAKEVVSDGLDGFVIDPSNTSQLCDAMIELLSNFEKAKVMGDSGRKKVRDMYLDEAFGNNLRELIAAQLRCNG